MDGKPSEEQEGKLIIVLGTREPNRSLHDSAFIFTKANVFTLVFKGVSKENQKRI